VPLVTLLLWLGGVRTAWVEGFLSQGVAADLQGIAVAALVCALVLVLWGELERQRAAAKPRRLPSEHDEAQSVSEGMGLPLREVYKLRDARRALVNFTPEGGFLRVDGLDRPGPSRRSEMDTMLQRLAETVAEARSLEELTRPMLEMLERASGFESVYLTTIDEKEGLQHVLFSHNVRRLQIPEGLAVKWRDTLCRRALEDGETGVVDVPSRWPDAEAGQDLGIRSYATAPVHAGSELYGTLCAASRHQLTLTPEAERLLHMFAILVGHHVERESLVARLQQVNAELSAVALVDPLTGLANRRALLGELARMLDRSQRDGSRVHVAFLDLDGFEDFNDQHGRGAGDELLTAVAARIDSAVRGGDFAARYGGDEFVVLAWSADGEGSGEDLRQRLARATEGGYELSHATVDYPGASVGVTTALPGDASDAVLARADEAMYEAKRRRRARR